MDLSKIISLQPGHYIVAVSGGVDSMALLDILAKKHQGKESGIKFTVAHFDHGIRDTSHLDRQLVKKVAESHRLPFVYEEGNLGPETSEAEARQARYNFLRTVQNHTNANAIITAHHLDDIVETAVLNILRGTGRKGLSSLNKHHNGIIRPLLHVPKHSLKSYAEANGLTWHEDETNLSEAYKRNYVRHSILKKAKLKSPEQYHQFVTVLRRQRELNHAIDQQLDTLLHLQPSRAHLRRRDVVMLPYKVATELVAQWLRQNGKFQLSRWLVDRLTVAIRTAQPNTDLLLDSTSKVSFHKSNVEFVNL